MLIVTINEIPGKKLEALGVVRGSTVQSRNFGHDLMAGFRTLVGGEVTDYADMLTEARQIATGRMVKDAESLGADAIVGMRYASASVMQGAELLMHIGIDTVKLGGKHFTYLVNEGDKVKKGQPLIRFELEAIKAEGYPVTTPLIVCNTDDYAAVAAKASGTVKQGDALLELKH